MKAAQFFTARDIRVVDIASPTPNENEALIAIEWCGICGSDLHEYLAGKLLPPYRHTLTLSRPLRCPKKGSPLTMSHEFCGRVINAPPTSGLSNGQAVMVDPRFYCGKCSRCAASHTHDCPSMGLKGFHGGGGGFSEMVAVETRHCYPLPDSVDLSLAALIEPLAVAWHAVTLCGMEDWSSKAVLILGGGPIGIAHTSALRALGCRNIFISEPTSTRAAQSRKIADHVFNPVSENVAELCGELTSGEGVDVVFDCAGVQKGMDAGFDGAPMVVPFLQLLSKEISLKASITYNERAFRETVDAFAAGRFKGLEGMVTSRIHINAIVENGFEELVINKDHHIKIMVTPQRSWLE
ncbi:threonine dehydrogenase [Karstenula rhodostoma CBS 690.94]|uniref:Threonine dehydrogenase n=1 Tax=Karstenula rhodostoma CBS 690.94 TaxID=1392251 RepID=A0A9P4P610_9PLEO|nr:threonine dehydrogenase [Karstenula rhodostoma CBS 690.94]